MAEDRDQRAGKRNFLTRLATRAAIFLGVVYQVAIEQKLFIHTFFCQRETGQYVTPRR